MPLKSGENEVVDFVVAPVLVVCRGRNNGLQGAVGPVLRPGRTLIDPVPEEGDLLPAKGCPGRHSLVRIVMSKAVVELTLLRSTRNDEGFAGFPSLQGPGSIGQYQSALLLHTTVAFRAVFIKQWLDVPCKIDGCSQAGPRCGQRQRGTERELTRQFQTGTLNLL